MKKIIILITFVLFAASCTLLKDELDGANIYTTSYPIAFLTTTLYEDHSTITSIYPADVDINDYSLTDKQIKDYSNSDLFIYNGLTHEKNIAKEFVNNNGNILLIDAAHSLVYDNSIEELWLSPNNYLMLAKNIRDNLIEYIDNQYIHETINTNYDNLAETLSLMDADLRSIGKNALNNTFVVSSNAFKYLENYGFNIISLEEEQNNSGSLENIKTNFENNKYAALILESDAGSEFITSLNTIENLVAIEIANLEVADINDDYISIMHEFIANIEAASIKIDIPEEN